jgi:hypothetical protein
LAEKWRTHRVGRNGYRTRQIPLSTANWPQGRRRVKWTTPDYSRTAEITEKHNFEAHRVEVHQEVVLDSGTRLAADHHERLIGKCSSGVQAG